MRYHLARKAAFYLSRDMMVPVVLFCIDGQFGVMEAREYDGDEGSSVHEYDPHQCGCRAH
nr:hypothetical protein [Devosia naphthalenivorans]